MIANTAHATLFGDIRSARDRVEAALAKINLENPKLHAISALFPEAALEQADALDQAAHDGLPIGPLHGVPILFKELVDIAGQPTQFGSLCYAGGPAHRNAPVIDRLQAAGAILLGTTHMVEFAVGSWGTNVTRGTPQNPSDMAQHRVPGGSSSGSAVAVAADLAPIAFGSDTGGSIRIPATLCGIMGFKPSYGLIPMQGVAPTGPSFDTLGPLTKTVFEARRATEAAAGVSLAHVPIDLSELTVAHVADNELEPIDPHALAAYTKIKDFLIASGATLVEINMPMSFPELQQVNGDIVSFEAYRHLQPLVDDEDTRLDPNVRRRVRQGAKVTEAEYRKRIFGLQTLRKNFDGAMGAADIFLLPGTPIPAARIEDVNEDIIPMSRYTRAANCLNLCAIAMPSPIQAGGLPVGFQLAARSGRDAALLAAASAVETSFYDG